MTGFTKEMEEKIIGVHYKEFGHNVAATRAYGGADVCLTLYAVKSEGKKGKAPLIGACRKRLSKRFQYSPQAGTCAKDDFVPAQKR